MKNKQILGKAILLSVLCILFLGAMTCTAKEAAKAKAAKKKNSLSDYGQLSVQGTKLCAEDGSPVVLRGMSSHGLAWYPEYTNYAALNTLRDYGANVFRIAMYPDQNDGYLEEPNLNEKLLYAAIENALAADLYVIVDWHVLRDENPLKHKDKAIEFFTHVAKRYGKEAGILYEICNEPNGDTTYQDIVEYSDEVIPVIRKYAPNAVILVGTPKFCTTLEDAVADPLPYENVMYTYHYYSDVSDCRYALEQLRKALNHEIPVFVSEWGYKSESDNLEDDTKSLDSFMDFLDKQGVSWTNWALSNKEESYSFLSSECETLSGWDLEQLTLSGKYVLKRLQTKPY